MHRKAAILRRRRLGIRVQQRSLCQLQRLQQLKRKIRRTFHHGKQIGSLTKSNRKLKKQLKLTKKTVQHLLKKLKLQSKDLKKKVPKKKLAKSRKSQRKNLDYRRQLNKNKKKKLSKSKSRKRLKRKSTDAKKRNLIH